ncbi:CU044_2847 family protein [Streptomyces sp. NPDC093094]|uniref:CU044_2847 family protein n=1 Tax=Streptomyces sp. NPDC093094 TaxID=3366026 RepID=UPI0038125A57
MRTDGGVMGGGIERIRLDDGTVVWARISTEDEEAPHGGGYRDTGAGERVMDLAGGLAGTVGGVVRSLRAGLDTTAPVEVCVGFGIELSAQAGRIVSAIAGAGGQATLSVSLTWTEPAGDGGAPRPPAADEPPEGTADPASGTV